MQPVIIPVNENLQLKSWDIKSAPELFALTDKNRDYLAPWLPWAPFVKQIVDSENFINKSLGEMTNDKSMELGIWDKNKLVGCIGLHGLSLDNRRAAIGYWLDSDHQGQGIVTQSVTALINYCYDV
jgi:ribosomal-protein-serine acetyltransferase